MRKKFNSELIRLNKYISQSGLCSRRSADQLIISGKVKVNNKLCNALGTKISENDKVIVCLLYTSPSPRDATLSRMPSSA